jgi:hypothetical protein
MATLINIDGSEIEIHPLSMLRRREELRSSGNKRFCEVQMVRPWSVHILAFQIGKGYCGLCTRCLSVNELSDPQSIYEEHASHISQVSISGTIIGLSEYRGLEMNLPVAWFAAANYSEGILTVPYAIFKLSCQYCHSEDFPLTSKDVRTFRALHGAHIESTYAHVVTHTPLGQIIAQAISVQAQYSDDQLAKASANQQFPALVTSRARQLQNLWLSLSCMPRGLDCRGCNSKQYFKDWSQSEGFLAEHRDHI